MAHGPTSLTLRSVSSLGPDRGGVLWFGGQEHLSVWRLGVWNQGASMVGFWGKLTVSHTAEKEKERASSPPDFYKVANPTGSTYQLPKALRLIPSHWGVRAPMQELGGNTSQFTAEGIFCGRCLQRRISPEEGPCCLCYIGQSKL